MAKARPIKTPEQLTPEIREQITRDWLTGINSDHERPVILNYICDTTGATKAIVKGVLIEDDWEWRRKAVKMHNDGYDHESIIDKIGGLSKKDVLRDAKAISKGLPLVPMKFE